MQDFVDEGASPASNVDDVKRQLAEAREKDQKLRENDPKLFFNVQQFFHLEP